MKKTRYIFGYLFVRFSKLLAILTAVATTVTVIYLWVDYGMKADNLAYRKTSTLDLQCTQLEDELEFAKREVSRIGSVGDLPTIKFPSGSRNSDEFNALLGSLQSASQRQSVLKERLTTGFSTRTELLRSKIRSAIESIEASRASARPEPQVQSSPAPPPVERIAPSPSATSHQRTVFDSMDSRRLDNMLGTMRQVGDFLDQLASKAVKEENKKLIQDAKAALNDLTSWLPSKQVETSGGSSIERPSTNTSVGESTKRDDGPPPDPLTTARNNYQNLGNAIEMVRTEISRNWRIDRIMLETTQMAEVEAQKCRNAEASLKMLRLSSAGKVGIYLLNGLIVAFLILVFADFLQSFFDTASNSASILEFLERKN
jgi:hypothetical protein